MTTLGSFGRQVCHRVAPTSLTADVVNHNRFGVTAAVASTAVGGEKGYSRVSRPLPDRPVRCVGADTERSSAQRSQTHRSALEQLMRNPRSV